MDAPIDAIPLFVRAGSIIPTRQPRSKAHAREQKIAKVRVYPGADADFTLYSDDGTTYAYEKGDFKTTRLHWDDAAKTLTYEGAPAWPGDARDVIEIMGR